MWPAYTRALYQLPTQSLYQRLGGVYNSLEPTLFSLCGMCWSWLTMVLARSHIWYKDWAQNHCTVLALRRHIWSLRNTCTCMNPACLWPGHPCKSALEWQWDCCLHFIACMQLSATCPMQLQHSFPTTLGGSVAGLSRIDFLYNKWIQNFISNMLTRSMSQTI